MVRQNWLQPNLLNFKKKKSHSKSFGEKQKLINFPFLRTPGVGDGQGGLACCGSWGRKESDMTERLI